jgi:hypothetical protein
MVLGVFDSVPSGCIIVVVLFSSAESVDKVVRFIRHDSAAAHLMSERQVSALHALITPW